MQRVLLAIAVVMSSLISSTQAQAATPAGPCQGAEHRQFDFWIGHWDVYDAGGKKVGENLIEPFAGGCGLLENWTGSSGTTGKSLNMYDLADKQWHQAWVDSSGSRLTLDGHFIDGKMVLGSEAPDPARPGGTVRQQITWTPAPDGSVRQLWQSSNDGGKSWTTAFDGKYVRRK